MECFLDFEDGKTEKEFIDQISAWLRQPDPVAGVLGLLTGVTDAEKEEIESAIGDMTQKGVTPEIMAQNFLDWKNNTFCWRGHHSQPN